MYTVKSSQRPFQRCIVCYVELIGWKVMNVQSWRTKEGPKEGPKFFWSFHFFFWSFLAVRDTPSKGRTKKRTKSNIFAIFEQNGIIEKINFGIKVHFIPFPPICLLHFSSFALGSYMYSKGRTKNITAKMLAKNWIVCPATRSNPYQYWKIYCYQFIEVYWTVTHHCCFDCSKQFLMMILQFKITGVVVHRCCWW